jgi:hypothetical protein
VSADYTRTIVFKVEDQAIKRATDRITRSLSNIERSLKKIETKGFTGLAKGAEQASKQVLTASESIGALTQRSKALKKVGGDALNTISNRFKAINKGITIQPFKGLVDEITRVPFVVKRSFQDFRTLFEILGKGGKDIVGLVSGIIALGNNIKNFGVTTRSNLTSVGRLLEENSKKAGNFLNTIGLAIQMQDSSVALQRNTLLARQKSLPGNLLRNTLRSRAGREGSGFADFSKAAGEYNPYSLSTSGAGRPRQFGPAGNLAGDARFVTDPVSKAIRRHEIKKQKMLKRELKIEEQILGIRGQAINMERQYQSPIGPTPLTRMEKFGFGNKASSKGMFASPGGAGGRVKGALQSGMIGGGFPLLFGQSGLASVLGGVGGAAGGALSPGFGFAGSIVATAAAQKIQEIIDFRKSVAELNKDMKSMGFNAGYSASEIVKLGKSLNITKQEAVQVAEQFKRFGKDGGGFAALFGGDVGSLNAVVQANDFASAMGAIKQLNKDLAPETELRYLQLLKTAGVEETINEVIKDRTKILKDEFKQKQLKDRVGLGKFGPTGVLLGQMFQGPKQAKDLVQFDASQDQTIIRLEAYREQFRQIKLEAEEIGYSVATEVERIDTELRRLNNTQYQVVELSKSIGSSFSESFKGIIQGTMTVQDAFRNMFSRIADHFLDMAARMAAAQLQKGILSLFNFGANPLSALSNSTLPTNVGLLGNDVFRAAGGPVTGGSPLSSGPSIGMPGIPSYVPSGLGNLELKAAGGPVSGGSPYLVGEKGPELFVPGSSGNIVPNHAMGGANVVVNVDASGSSVEGDAGAAQELGSMLAAAIQAELVKEKRPGGLLA